MLAPSQRSNRPRLEAKHHGDLLFQKLNHMKTKKQIIESVYAPKRKKAAQRKIALATLAIAALTVAAIKLLE